MVKKLAALLVVCAGVWMAFRMWSPKRSDDMEGREARRASVETLRRSAGDLPPSSNTVIKPLPKLVAELQEREPRLLAAADPASLPPLSAPEIRRPGETEMTHKMRARVVEQIQQFEKEASLSTEQATAVRKLLADIQIAYVVSQDALHRQYAAADDASTLAQDYRGLMDSLQSRLDVEFRRLLSAQQIERLYGVPGRLPLARYATMRSATGLTTRPFELDERKALSGG